MGFILVNTRSRFVSVAFKLYFLEHTRLALQADGVADGFSVVPKAKHEARLRALKGTMSPSRDDRDEEVAEWSERKYRVNRDQGLLT